MEIIATNPSSPLEISKKLKTSIAYVSQQLKLLEAANIVAKEKTGSVEKGKPRTIFSISNEILYITALTKNSPVKKSIHLTDYHKTILSIWFLDDYFLHYPIEKFYLALEKHLPEINGIFVDVSSPKYKLIVVSESKKAELFIHSYFKEAEFKIECAIISNKNLKFLSNKKISPIYDPKFLLKDLEKMKGGKSENEV